MGILLGLMAVLGEPLHAPPSALAKGERYPLYYPRIPLGAVQEIWRETFEAGASGWQLDSLWAVGSPTYGPGSAYEGNAVLGTALDTTYPPNAYALALSPPISLPPIDSLENLWLVFAEYMETESCCDFGAVEVHTSGGVDTVRIYSGVSNGWNIRKISLKSYAGQTVRIGFRFASNWNIEYAGWYVDDLKIVHEVPDSLSINLQSVEISEFPTVYVKMKVDSFYQPVSGLAEQHIQLWEDGQPVWPFVLYPPSAGGGVSAVDFIFMVDNSGSMSDDIDAVKANIHQFAADLAASGINFALGALSFGQSGNGGYPIVYHQGQLTQDIQTFLNIVDQFGASGGFEPGWDAIVTALQQFQFRPGALKVLLLITDENVTDDGNQGNATYQDALQALQSQGAILYALIDDRPNSYQDYGTLAEATGGSVFFVQDPMSSILDSVAAGASAFWTLQYATPNPQQINAWRTVVVQVTYAGVTRRDTITYNPANLIVIRPAGLLDSLLRYGFSLPAGAPFPVEVEVTDSVPPYVHGVAAQVMPIGDSAASWRVFSLASSGTRWSVTLPGSLITQPGIRLQIVAQDSLSSASLPPQGDFTFGVGTSRAPWLFHWHRDTAQGDIRLPLIVVTDHLDSLIVEIRRSGDLYVNRYALSRYNRTLPLQTAIDSIASLTGVSSQEIQDTLFQRAQRAGLSLTLSDTVWFFAPPLNAIPGTLSVYLYRFHAVSGYFRTFSPPTGWWSVILTDSLLPVPVEAYRFAPVFVMESGARVEPVFYEDFLNQTSLVRMVGSFPNVTLDTWSDAPSDVDLPAVVASAQECEAYYLSLPHLLRPGGTGGFHRMMPRAVHVRVREEGGARYIEYLLFFPVNDGPNLHEGDWERVILKFDPPDASEPSEVWLSYHDFWWRLGWDDLPKIGRTHPVIGIHKGSHALTPPVPNPGTPFEVSLPSEALERLENLLEKVNLSLPLSEVASAIGLFWNEHGEAVIQLLQIAATQSPYWPSIRSFVARVVDEMEFSPGTSRSDTLYPESYGTTQNIYVLRPIDDIAWSTEDVPFYWGAPIFKWKEETQGFFAALGEWVALVTEGSQVYVVGSPPPGPIREIPQAVASKAVVVNVSAPSGYRWIYSPWVMNGAKLLTAEREGQSYMQLWTQIALRETLRFVPDSSEDTGPVTSIPITIYMPDQLDGPPAESLQVSPLFHGETLLVVVQTRVEGDSIKVQIPGFPLLEERRVVAVPNPFRIERHRTVTLKLWAEKPGELEVRIVNEAGIPVRKIKAIVSRSGEAHVLWDGKTDSGRRVANGVYFVQVRGGGVRYVGKLIVVRR